jgi:hypothetical protein
MLLALSCRIPSTHAFSNILLSKSNCWTELSVEEVIMNNKVVSAADSDDPQMRIQLAPSTTTDETYRWVASEIGGDRVEIITDLPIDIPLRVVTTNEDTDPDYQYAMDVTNERGSFADGGACEGKKRISARSSDTVVVTITQSGAILVAAWAAGHEAVRLTPPLTFVVVSSAEEKIHNPETDPEHVAAPGDAESNHEHGNESDENVDPQKALDQDARLHDLQEQVQVHHQNLLDKATNKRDRLHEERAPDHDRIHQVHNPEEAAHNLAREQLMRNRHRDGSIGKVPPSTLRKSSFHKNRLLQYDIGFHHHGGLVSVYSYIKGAFFLFMVSGVAVYTLRFCSRQPTNKGRREL